MSQPLITIGICAYNAQSTIKRAINSAIAQDWSSLEIVVVDDCSSDSTWEKLETIANINNKVRIFRNNKNAGVAVTRNHILAEAKGDFIAFFDDDDESSPDRILRQYERLIDYERDYASDG